eukprot:COSAG02_NODE_329_length_24516_cov_11.403448_2_plen_75_part_00
MLRGEETTSFVTIAGKDLIRILILKLLYSKRALYFHFGSMTTEATLFDLDIYMDKTFTYLSYACRFPLHVEVAL